MSRGINVDLSHGREFLHLLNDFDTQFKDRFATPLYIFHILSVVEPHELPHVSIQAGVDMYLEPIGRDVYKINLYLRKRFSKGYIHFQDGILTFFIQSDGASHTSFKVSNRWLNNLYPQLSHLFLRPSQLLDLLDDLDRIEQEHRLVILDYRVIEQGRTRPTGKRWRRGESYNRKTIEKVIERDKAILDSIHFEFFAGKTNFNAKVDRKGRFVFYSGIFSDFYRLLIMPSLESGLENKKYFSDRERKIIGEEIVIRPIRLTGKFKKKDFMELRNRLQREYSVSVLHSGNPWLFAQVLDYSDGSSFDVYGYEDEIRILPFSKASPQSLTRFYSIVSEALPLSRLEKDV